MSERPRWGRVVAVLVLLLVIAPFGYFPFLWLQHKTIGVDFARVGERYDPEQMPRNWTLLQVYKLKIKDKELRLFHYETELMLPEEHGVVVDSQGLINEIIRGDDALHRRLMDWETEGALKR